MVPAGRHSRLVWARVVGNPCHTLQRTARTLGMDVIDRREFMARVGRFGTGACLACAGGQVWAAAPRAELQREVDFYEGLSGNRVRCGVCPRRCIRSEGETGFCRTRINLGGRWFTRIHGNPCVLRIDSIEKMPLNHFRPGSQTMTIGSGGCNLHCLYCQNWEQALSPLEELQTFDLSPSEAVEAAGKRGIDTIAFNYTGLIAALEYAKDVARAARRAELKVVAATGAYVEPEPLLDLAQYVDAFVISLKGYTEDFYRQVVAGALEPVLEAIKAVKNQTDCWLELVNLVVPTYNDDLRGIRRMCGWIRREVGVTTPVHFARFVPMYRLTNLPRTPVQTLERACEIARQVGLRHVYTSNIAPHEGSNTYCDKCGSAVIQRLGFRVLENKLVDGRCPKCHRRLPGVWA